MSIENPWQENDEGDSQSSLITRAPASASELMRYAKWIAIVFAIACLYVLFDHWIYSSLQNTAMSSLQSTVDAKEQVINLWLDRQRSEIVDLSTDGQIREQALRLLRRSNTRDKPKQNAASTVQTDLARLLKERTQKQSRDWMLLDPNGRVISSNQFHWVNMQLDLPAKSQEMMDRALPTVTTPFWLDENQDKQEPKRRKPIMISFASFTDGVRSIGSLAMVIDPAGEFSDMMQSSFESNQIHGYAFDRRGVMISRCQDLEALRQSGLLSQDTSSAILTLDIRDPGFDITRSNHVVSGKPALQLTEMADHATRGARGWNVDGYRDYRGKPVLGAWRWLKQYDIGIAIESNRSALMAPLRLTRLFLATALGFGGIIGLGNWYFQKKRARVSEDQVSGTNRRLGPYVLTNVIGEGGMGKVYLGRHESLERDVAIKVLEGEHVTRRSLTRFEREVRMTAQLRHPNTINIYDYGQTADKTFFYVMEYIDGITLLDLVKGYGRQSPDRVIYLLLQICGSLSEAHRQSMIHRDIKPGNILLTSHAGLYDLVKVLDFGLVKKEFHDTVEMTQVASITGTPLYMSPEAVRDASNVDRRSDIYSVGAVGYYLLTGLPLFEGENAADVCAQQLHEPPKRPGDRLGTDFPEDLQNVLMSCLRKQPDERPSSADDLAQALTQCIDANKWNSADACQWWDDVYETGRDESDELVDNEEDTQNATPRDA